MFNYALQQLYKGKAKLKRQVLKFILDRVREADFPPLGGREFQDMEKQSKHPTPLIAMFHKPNRQACLSTTGPSEVI